MEIEHTCVHLCAQCNNICVHAHGYKYFCYFFHCWIFLYTDLFQIVNASSVFRLKSTIAVDTNVASYILDGAVWTQSPIDLILYMDVSQVTSKEELRNSLHMKRRITCYEWAMSCSSELVLTPTVMMELMLSSQVSLIQLIEEKRWSHVYKCILFIKCINA